MKLDAEKIRAWLKENKRTQFWLALKLGVSPAAVTYWLNHTKFPDVIHLKGISTIIGVGWKTLLKSDGAE
jgi:transcriptional regulator with XRE-family HTH domain